MRYVDPIPELAVETAKEVMALPFEEAHLRR